MPVRVRPHALEQVCDMMAAGLRDVLAYFADGSMAAMRVA